MNYLIHAGLLLAACFLYYWVMLRSETHFRLNRWVLLGCLAGSLALPLITMPAAWSLREAMTQEPTEMILPEAEATTEITTVPPQAEVSGLADKMTTRQSEAASTITSAPPANPIDWFKVLRWVYLAGVLVFGLNFLVQLGQLLIRSLRRLSARSALKTFR